MTMGSLDDPILPKQVDIVGLAIMGGVIVITLLYLAYTIAVKRWRQKRQGHPILTGAVRWAAAAGDLKALDALSLAPEFDIESALDGFTALHAAVVGGQRDVVLWLCQRGADVHAMKDDDWEDSALHYAAARGDMATVQVLLAYGADPSPMNAFGATPAELARKRKHVSVADYLDAVASGKTTPPLPQEVDGWKPLNKAQTGTITTDISDKDMESGFSTENHAKMPLTKEQDAAWRAAMARSQDGLGTEGTKMKPYTKLFRVFAVLMQISNMGYLIWRGARTLLPYPAGYYAYSIIFYLAELSFMPLSYVFVASMWNLIERPSRWAGDMLPKDKLPQVDVYVVRYSEDVDVLEPSIIAALNMNWPGDKLTVHILDDGADKNVLKMVRRLRFQLTSMKREARLVYVARRRRQGVPHHAKAGNINHAILRSQGTGDYIMVLDTDMIVHPNFLQSTIGHFYQRGSDGTGWVQKKRTAFIQTPQDFWNVPPSDPMVHCARFFYGPMLQGRDGIDASPCCGTGVVFSRTALVSLGGQSYGSITEDYNTSMNLFAAGFSSMYLNDRLVYGMAPEGLIDVFKQRQRWAMGALQILLKDNPLKKAGLSFMQSIIFFEAAAYHFLAISTCFMVLVPFTLIFFEIAPMAVYHIWEFAVAFGTYFLLNRFTMWTAARGVKGADIELWRGWQMWIWMAPNHVISIWKVLTSETWLRKLTGSKAIAFKVTKKEGNVKPGTAAPAAPYMDIQSLWSTFCVTWYFVLYDLAFIAAILFTIWGAISGHFSIWILVVNITSLFWAALNCWCTWPPVYTLFPRVETEQGWRIKWKAFLPLGATRESEFSGFGTTSTRRVNMPVSKSDLAQISHSLSGFGPAPAVNSVANNEYNNEHSISTEDVSSYASGNMTRFNSATALAAAPNHSGQSIPNGGSGHLSPKSSQALKGTLTPKGSRSLGRNFGRVSAPLGSAASLEASALLTGTILPEREAYNAAAAHQPSLLAVAPSGEIYPAPAGSMPYDVLSSILSSEQSLDQKGSHGAQAVSARRLLTVAEAEEEPVAVAQDKDHHRSSNLSTAITIENGAHELDSLATLTGSALPGLAPVSNPLFPGASPFMQDKSLPGESIPIHAIAFSNSEDYVDCYVEEEPIQDSAFLNDGTSLSADFLSPFAIHGQNKNEWTSSSFEISESYGKNEVGTPGHSHQIVLKDAGAMEQAQSAAQVRLHATTQHIIDITATLSAGFSAALRTGSVFVLPVVPDSVFDHSIASTPSFEASPFSPRDFTYLGVSFTLVLGLVACSIAEGYLR